MSGFGAFASGMAGGIHGGLAIKKQKEDTEFMRGMMKENLELRRMELMRPPGAAPASGGSAPLSMTGAVSGGASAGSAPVDFSAYEARYELPSGFLSRTAQLESSMGKNMKNPNSSATGPFQFITSTAKAYGLSDPMDWTQSTDAASRLGRDNATVLSRALGRAPTAAELYLAHQQGGGGAAKLLSNPSARAVDIVGEKAVRLNGGKTNMTAQEFANLWITKFEGGAKKPPAPAAAPLTMTAFRNLN